SLFESKVTCPVSGSCQLKQEAMSAFCLECPDFCSSCTPSPGSPPPPARSPRPAPAFPPPRASLPPPPPASPPTAASPPLSSSPSPSPPSLPPPAPFITLSPPVPAISPPPEPSASPPPLLPLPSPPSPPSPSPSVPPPNIGSGSSSGGGGGGGGVSVAVVAGIAAAAVCVVVVLLVLGFCWWKRKKQRQHSSGESYPSAQPFLDTQASAGAGGGEAAAAKPSLGTTSSGGGGGGSSSKGHCTGPYQPVTPMGSTDAPPLFHQFALRELEAATGCWSTDCKIGSGAFGDVYRAVCPGNADVVWAVKRARIISADFRREVDQMASKHHPNLVRLLGFCSDVDTASQLPQQILVYEFMAQGDLAKRIKTDPPLTLQQRLDILIGAAKGLEYLHSFGIVHRDIKPANILLDSNMQAMVSDFGLLRMGEGRSNPTPTTTTTTSGSSGSSGAAWGSTRVMGTPGYVDPVYYKTHKATPSLDVYSYGVVMLELVLGRGPVVLVGTECVNIKDWAAPLLAANNLTPLLDPSLQSQPPASLSREKQISLTKALAELAMACTRVPTASRPCMSDLISSLSSLKREFFGMKEGGRGSSRGRKGQGDAGAGGGGGGGGVIHEEGEDYGTLGQGDGFDAGPNGGGTGAGGAAGPPGEAPGKKKQGGGGGGSGVVGAVESAEEVDRAFMEGVREQGRTLEEELAMLNHMLVMSAVHHSGMHLSAPSSSSQEH
ncbi:hypothetical protein CLOP_g11016, partial [Closterium sp. NIES-67]